MIGFLSSFKSFVSSAYFFQVPLVTITYTEEQVRKWTTRVVIVTALISIVVAYLLFEFIHFLINRRTHNVFFGDYNVVTVRHNRIVPLPHPEKEGYTFCGWYRDENFKYKFQPTETVIKDLYLYPKWEKDPESTNP